MPHLLEQKIGQVRRRAQRLFVLHGLGWTVALVVGSVLALATVDYAIRFQDLGIRLMCSLALIGVVVWSLVRYWWPRWEHRLSDLEIAQRVERRFPRLRDRLSSALEFLRQDEADLHAGSAALRRAVIVQTADEVDALDVSQVFNPAPARRALWIGGTLALLALVVTAVSPASARVALARLLRPLGDDAWPRYYQVEFRDPHTRIAAGQDFEVELLSDDAHRVPPEAKIIYRYETGDGASEEESEVMQSLGTTRIARKQRVTRPFWYRATGGDDASMPWIRLEVLEPPRIESMEITLHPPDYSGLPVETSDNNIHALRGTRVALSGRSTKRLRAATLQQEGSEPLTLNVADDRYGFSLSSTSDPAWQLEQTGPYWIILEDEQGIHAGEADRWEARAVTDQAPTVTVEQPASNVFVTPQGEIALKVSAKDDLALHDMALHYSRSDQGDGEDFGVPLYEGPTAVPPQEGVGLLASGRLGESRTVEYRWNLGSLALKPGTQLTFWATAGDYVPQLGKSTVRKASIITAAELEDRLVERQSLIVGELQRTLKLQQEARAQTKALEIQLSEVGRLNKQDIDNAQSAELNQRQIQRTLTSESEGLPGQIQDFLSELATNRVDSPEIQRHMATIRDELQRLAGEHLGPLQQELTQWIKSAQAELAQPADKSAARLAEPLAAATGHQDQVISSLEGLLGELSQWDNYRRFSREIAHVQREQEQLSQATKELGQKTLGRDLKDLDPQQKADLKKLAGQQVDLSRRLEKVQQQMAEMSQRLQSADPLSAASIADGLHHAQQQAISGQMRQTGEQMDRNQLGQAAQQQAKTLKDLEELSAILANRREQELSRLAKQLREAEQEVSKLRQQQAGLRKKFREAEKLPEPERQRQLERLTREQKQLEQESARLARRLERLQAESAGRQMSRAAGSMEQAGKAGEKADAGGAEQQGEQAEKDLEEVQRQIAQRRRQAEADLAQEQMGKLEDALKSLHDAQRKMVSETERLENLRATAGRFTRAQMSTIHDLSRQQKVLETETSLLAQKLAPNEVIHLALDGAARQMARAAELLTHRETGSPTQVAQEAARARLMQLLAALEGKQEKKGGGATGQGEGGEGGPNGNRQDGLQTLTQLKLLKLLQEDLTQRYRALAPGPPGPSPRELEELAQEQGRLAELTLKLSRPVEGNPEDAPDKLPDIRDDAGGLESVPPPDDIPLRNVAPDDARPESP